MYLKQEIIDYVKLQKHITDDRFDQLLGNYFDLGELQIQKFIGTKRLTSTLYLVIKEYVMYKFETQYKNLLEVKSELPKCYKQKTGLDEFFEQYRPLLLNYRSLCGAEMWLRV